MPTNQMLRYKQTEKGEKMVAVAINSGVCVFMLLIASHCCEDKNIHGVHTKNEASKEILNGVPADEASCNAENDPSCKNPGKHYTAEEDRDMEDMSKSHDNEESLLKTQSDHSEENASSDLNEDDLNKDDLNKDAKRVDDNNESVDDNSERVDDNNERVDDNNGLVDSSVPDAPADDLDVKQEETYKSAEMLETDHIESDVLSNNSTSNSSAVVQWFRYIVDQFLEEFKDGIYSRPAEPANATEPETNVSVAQVNETVETVESSPVNSTENTTENVETTEVTNTTDTTNSTDTKKVKFHCTGRNVTDNSNATVSLITSARLLQLLQFDKNETENMTDCLLVMFYAPWCQFCARTAPHYNAVARAFPQLDFVAVDTAQFSNLLARFGTVSVPNILVFHQSRAAVKFNQTERIFPNFVSFIQNATGLEPNTTVNVTEADYVGPVPSVPTDDPDYLLLISWIFVLFCSSFMFVKSHKGQQWITRVRILWQEHQHID